VSEWREVALGELLEIAHGYAFKGEYFATSGGNVLLTPKNFRTEGGLDLGPERSKYYDGPIDDKFVLSPGDIVVAMTDLKQDAPILGSAGRIPATGRYLHNQRIGKVEVTDRARLVREFVPWLLNSPSVRAQVRATATGATVRHTAPTRIRDVIASIPPPRVQTAISATLGAFDELIAINERRIELLENLARALYREWFERLRFPEYDADDGVPADWRRRPASEVFTVNPRIKSSQTAFPKVTMGDVDERFAIVFPSEETTRVTGSRFQRDDMLFARITPCLENGKTGLVKFLEPDVVGVGSTEFIVLRGNAVGPAFTYCAARSDALRQHAIKSMSGATGRQRVATNAFDSLELIEPPPAIGDYFEMHAAPLLDEGFALACQSRALARARDLLLPRLVTGRLDISDVHLGDLLPEDDAG
jgi:type I restriction enzyme S subunit